MPANRIIGNSRLLAPLVDALESEVRSDSPTALWLFNETSGITLNDRSANALYHGTFQTNASGAWNKGTLNNTPGPVLYDPQGYADFQSGGYVQSNVNLPTLANGASVTIEAIFRVDGVGTKQAIFVKGSNGVAFNYGLLALATSGNLAFRNSANDYDLGVAITAGQWAHVVAVTNGSGTIAYVNGSAGSNVASATVTADSVNTWSIACRARNSQSEFVAGDYRMLAIYSGSALSAARVAAHYAAYSGG